MTAEWWPEFFATYVELQAADVDAGRDAREAAFIRRVLDLPPGAAVLDAPCGAGRIAVELAAAGFRLTGLDFNPRALDLARSAAAARGVHVSWLHGDIRALPFEGEFDAVINWFGSFGYFDEAGNDAVLASAARALRPGGRFLLEGHTLETMLPRFRPRGWCQTGDIRVLEDRRFDALGSRVESSWTFLRGATERTHVLSMRVYSLHELADRIARAGLELVTALDPLTDKPFDLGATRLALVARRPR